MPTKTVLPSWVKEFRKAVKASTPKGWLVMQENRESTRVQIRRDGKEIAEIHKMHKPYRQLISGDYMISDKQQAKLLNFNLRLSNLSREETRELEKGK